MEVEDELHHVKGEPRILFFEAICVGCGLF